VNSDSTLHISIVLAICVPKIITFDGDLTKFWQKQVGSFLAHLVFCCHVNGKTALFDETCVFGL